MRILTTCLAAAAVTAVLTVPAAAAPQLLAREQAPFTAAAARGVVAWSAFDPGTGRYRLKLLRDGTVSTPAIADRGAPFDVDLGRLTGGNVGAVYSRCADDEVRGGCDLHLFDLDAGRERKLTSVSSPSRSELHPSLDGGQVAFARRYGKRTVLYRGPIDGEPSSDRQPSPRQGGVDDLELNVNRLYYVWADEGGTEFGRDSLYRVSGERAVRMYATESGGANASDFIGLTYTGGYVYFGETNNGSGTGNRLYRATTGGGRLQETIGSPSFLSADWTGDRFVTASGYDGCEANSNDPPQASDCLLERTDQITWRPATKLP